MFEREERELQQLKERYRQIEISRRLDQSIESGVAKAKLRQRRLKTVRWTALAASLLLLFTVTTVRISPAVAAYLSQFPGMEGLVRLIQFDKGLQSAAEHDFIQSVGRADQQYGITFSVDHLIADQSRINILYSISGQQAEEDLHLSKIEVLDEAGEPLAWGISWGLPQQQENGRLAGRIDLHLGNESEIPDLLSLQVMIDGLNRPEAEEAGHGKRNWTVHIPVDKSQFVGRMEEILLNQTVTVEGQTIYFDTLTVYPTRSELSVRFADENSKQIMGFDRLLLTDDTGQEWTTITNGVSASQLAPDHVIYYLQSHYFAQPKQLFLLAEGIQAVDKEELEVIVDLEEERLIKAPDASLQLAQLLWHEDMIWFEFDITIPGVSKREIPLWFRSEATDQAGNRYELEGRTTQATIGGEESKRTISFYIKTDQVTTKPTSIHLTLSDYPRRLDGSIELPIIPAADQD